MSKELRATRRSQLIAPFGVGAMLDFPDDTLMSAGLDFWPTENTNLPRDKQDSINAATKIRDLRLENQLSSQLGRDIGYFLQPTEKQDRETFSIEKEDMPFVRFPTWCFCPSCKIMKKVKLRDFHTPQCDNRQRRFKNGTGPLCGDLPKRNRPVMKPLRFLIACEAGHIDDFPWEKWVHGDRICKDSCSSLFFNSNQRAGLSGINVSCNTCNISRSMTGAFTQGTLLKSLPEGRCTGRKPWLGEDDSRDNNCTELPRTVQRGASNTYFANTVSSILIPPYSKSIMQWLGRYDIWDDFKDNFDDNLSEIEGVFTLNEAGRIFLMRKAERKKIDYDILYETALLKYQESENSELKTETNDQFRFKEYKAFLGARPDQEDRFDFDITPMNLTEYSDWISTFFSKIVLVPQLRETRALIGFSRLSPVASRKVQLPLSNRPKNWLPGTEVRGEGIFLEFDIKKIALWETERRKLKIADKMNEKIQKSLKEGSPNFSRRDHVDERFILLHSFSHILIRQLSFQSGYDAGSLKERLYVNSDDNTNMAGILIYTASGDSEGSLGGLVAMGKPGFLEDTIVAAIEAARYCSNDPICLETESQGQQGLNAAACHSCLLLPETCCEHSNLVLDRSTLIGSERDSDDGFFGLLEFI